MRVKKIPGYGDKYLLREDGRLYRQRYEEWHVVRPSGDPPRVRLYKSTDKEKRICVHTLLQQVFPENYV